MRVPPPSLAKVRERSVIGLLDGGVREAVTELEVTPPRIVDIGDGVAIVEVEIGDGVVTPPTSGWRRY